MGTCRASICSEHWLTSEQILASSDPERMVLWVAESLIRELWDHPKRPEIKPDRRYKLELFLDEWIFEDNGKDPDAK